MRTLSYQGWVYRQVTADDFPVQKDWVYDSPDRDPHPAGTGDVGFHGLRHDSYGGSYRWYRPYTQEDVPATPVKKKNTTSPDDEGDRMMEFFTGWRRET